jgi:hypothetical protein
MYACDQVRLKAETTNVRTKQVMSILLQEMKFKISDLRFQIGVIVALATVAVVLTFPRRSRRTVRGKWSTAVAVIGIGDARGHFMRLSDAAVFASPIFQAPGRGG